jgi:hypothetical protein
MKEEESNINDFRERLKQFLDSKIGRGSGGLVPLALLGIRL